MIDPVGREGQRVGNYRLLRLLGRGGFAEVYLGEHLFLETAAAIKVLQMRLAYEELKDFLQEARTLARLEHPHIIQVLDFGLDGSMPFLVMHYASDGSLRQRYPKGTRLPLTSIVVYINQIAAALQYAHEQQLIHRDIKPENMLLERNNNVLLSDFGVAVIAQRSHRGRRQEVSGTLAYMAPEQLRGEACPASDQYALGVVVYEWISGSCPFQGSFAEVARQHVQAPPPPLQQKVPTISPAIEQVVLRALAKDPDRRFANVQDFAIALDSAFHQDEAKGALLTSADSTQFTGALEEQTLPVASDSSIILSFRSLKSKLNRNAALAWISNPPLWNVPYRRTPFFTGREDVLLRLYALLQSENATVSTRPQALTGLGGIGKTQTAVEYAYRYASNYSAILWVRADTFETILSDFGAIARLMNLPEQDEHDQQRTLEAVKHELEAQNDWLLILDNVEDLAIARECIPFKGGHVLLTTRIQATAALAHSIDLEKMEPDEGALFLLRRTGIIEYDAQLEDAAGADFIEAKDICQVMDGLPLALDQAGAYIEETACSLSDYLDRYHKSRSTLLVLRGANIFEHPEPVATTWLLSFEKVEQSHPAAAELLRLCAFLHPDAILEEIIINGTPDLGLILQPVASEPSKLDLAIATLRKFSLVRRNSDAKTLSMHRLVQAVLKDRMDENMQRVWAERTVRVVNRAFPDGDQVTSWPRCQQCLPHVQACVQLIEQWSLAFPEAARLLDQAGLYLLEHAQYAQAEFLLKKALDIRILIDGPEHPNVAESLNNLAGPYLYEGRYAQAEPLLRQALEIREHTQGSGHPDVAVSLNNLALLYNHQAKYAQAEPLFQRALAIWVQAKGSLSSEQPDEARTLNNLALLYQVQGKHAQAEPLYRRALSIWEHIRGPEHPDVAVSLNNLALLYLHLGKYAQAESIFQRVLDIREKTLGPEHPGVAHSLNYLAKLYQKQFRYADAELLFKQVLTIRKRALGPDHPDVAVTLNDLARLYSSQGRYVLAEPLFQQALDILEQALGPDHPNVAVLLKHYAVLLSGMNRKAEGVHLVKRAKAIHAKHIRQSQPEA